MPPMYSPEIESGVAEYAKQAERWFSLSYFERPAFEQRLRAGLHFMGADPKAENKIALTRHSGFFSLELFQAMICGGEPFQSVYIPIMWDRLLAAAVVVRAFGPMSGVPFADHQIDQARLLNHLSDRTFANLFASPARLVDRYQNAVASVDVIRCGDQSRGTGFVVLHQQQSFFVTCKHNVDPAEGVDVQAITTASGERLQLDTMQVSETYDVATARLTKPIDGPCFVLSDRIDVFDEVFTLGYPYVPRAEPVLLGHRGEMNGRANLYVEKCPALIISNLVSPGSSGGPVLSREGHCIGMTINWLEGEWGGTERLEKMRFSAALPAEILREAVEANQ